MFNIIFNLYNDVCESYNVIYLFALYETKLIKNFSNKFKMNNKLMTFFVTSVFYIFNKINFSLTLYFFNTIKLSLTCFNKVIYIYLKKNLFVYIFSFYLIVLFNTLI